MTAWEGGRMVSHKMTTEFVELPFFEEVRRHKNNEMTLVCVCSLCRFLAILDLFSCFDISSDNSARYCTEDPFSPSQQREPKTFPIFLLLPGPASPCLKARSQAMPFSGITEVVEVSVLPTFFKLGMLRYHEATPDIILIFLIHLRSFKIQGQPCNFHGLFLFYRFFFFDVFVPILAGKIQVYCVQHHKDRDPHGCCGNVLLSRRSCVCAGPITT